MEEKAVEKEKRTLGWLAVKIVFFAGLAASLFHLYVSATGILEAYRMRTTHLMFLLPLAFLIYPTSKKGRFSKTTVIDFVWFTATLVTLIYFSQFAYERLVARVPFVTPIYYTDYIAGIFLVIAVLEATRRGAGWGMVIVCLVALGYAFFGNHIPGRFGHTGTTMIRMAEQMSLSTSGIFGSTVGASASFIFMYILFGEFLEFSGAGQFFIDLAFAATGKARGGPAKMAVVASCLMGSISGSSTANVTSTGTYTIPLMKKVGYKPMFAGAVEAAASTGGQILPPVMGAASFLMAEYVGIPYIKLCVAAVIPALLFFVAVGFAVHFEAVKENLQGLKDEESVSWKTILRKKGYLALPLIVIIYTMVKGYSPYRAALYAIITVVVLHLIEMKGRVDWKAFVRCLAKGGRGAVMIAVTCAAAGIVIGVSSETGIGVKFASMIISIAHGNLYLILPMVMLASLILGMGLPTSAAYIMVAAIAVPALIQLGMNTLASHLFALYFGVFSGITPPVAISAFAAAALAGSNPMKTGWMAVGLALPAFVIPYVFIFDPALILVGSVPHIIAIICLTLVSVFAMAAGVVGCMFGPLRLWERLLMLGSAIGMVMIQSIVVTVVLLAVVLFVIIKNWSETRKQVVLEAVS